MTPNKIFLFFVAFLTIFTSCKKYKTDVSGAPASLHVINSVPSFTSELIVNSTGHTIIYADSKKLGYYAYDGKYSNGLLTFGLPSQQSLPISVVLSTDTIKPIFNQSISVNPGDIYSLFVGGMPESPSSLLVKDSIVALEDSITGVRFVNMSQDVPAMSVNISGNPEGSEITSLAFGQNSAFHFYPATSTSNFYAFEFREVETGNLLSTFYYDAVGSKYVTLILRGQKDVFPTIEVVRMNNN